METRHLRYFLAVVDHGSVSRASEWLGIAQPALSQQIATLEGEFRQQLLVRTKRGVTPTEAGQVLYRHAQIILRQFELAQSDVNHSGRSLSGQVSVGLAPGTAASALALPLLKAVRARHPSILLYLNENFGTTLSELVMNGRMDMAVLYAGKTPVHGLSFRSLLMEPLFLVVPRDTFSQFTDIDLTRVNELDLLLPRPYNYLRKYLDEAFASLQLTAHVVAEIESASTLSAAVAAGLGATILPESAARVMADSIQAHLCRIVSPSIELPLALCESDHLPLSEPAQAVKDIILELVESQPFSTDYEAPEKRH